MNSHHKVGDTLRLVVKRLDAAQEVGVVKRVVANAVEDVCERKE